MSIHSEHPFADPDDARDPVRRLRGRLAQAVTVWTTGEPHREGWTISSMLIADGDPPQILGLLDADSELAEVIPEQTTFTVNLLAANQTSVAEVFARLAPSPGGPFRTGDWHDDGYGPRLAGAAGWLGVRLLGTPELAGWALLVRGTIEVAEVGPGTPLFHLRGSYRS